MVSVHTIQAYKQPAKQTFFIASIVLLLGVIVPPPMAISNGGLSESLLGSTSHVELPEPTALGPSVLSWNWTTGRSPTVIAFLIFGESFGFVLRSRLPVPLQGIEPLIGIMSRLSPRRSGLGGSYTS